MSALSGRPCPTAPSTVRVTPVERCTSMPISTSRATTCSIWASVARSSITTTMTSISTAPCAVFFLRHHAVPFTATTATATSPSTRRAFHAEHPVVRVRSRRGGVASAGAVFFLLHQPALEAARFVDDPLEEPGDGVGTERPFGGDAAHVQQHLLFALRLVNLDAELLLHAPDLARDARALVQQPHQDLVDPIDVVPQIIQSGH